MGPSVAPGLFLEVKSKLPGVARELEAEINSSLERGTQNNIEFYLFLALLNLKLKFVMLSVLSSSWTRTPL